MNKTIFLFSIITIFILLLSCGLDTDTNKKEELGPTVGEIHCDAIDFESDAGDTVKFWVDATDPENGNLNYKWSISGGGFLGVNDQDSVTWKAAVGGNYTIGVTVSNDHKEISKNRLIIVRSSTIPYVKILEPEEGASLLQYHSTGVLLEADHVNDISQIDFYVNDSFIITIPGHDSPNYEFDWDVEVEGGTAEIKAKATSQGLAITGSDSIEVNIEGFIIGKFGERK